MERDRNENENTQTLKKKWRWKDTEMSLFGRKRQEMKMELEGNGKKWTCTEIKRNGNRRRHGIGNNLKSIDISEHRPKTSHYRHDKPVSHCQGSWMNCCTDACSGQVSCTTVEGSADNSVPASAFKSKLSSNVQHKIMNHDEIIQEKGLLDSWILSEKLATG